MTRIRKFILKLLGKGDISISLNGKLKFEDKVLEFDDLRIVVKEDIDIDAKASVEDTKLDPKI